MTRTFLIGLWLLLTGGTLLGQVDRSTELATEPVSESLLPTGRLVFPAGQSVNFHGRPNDLAVFEDWLFVKDRAALRIIDLNNFELIQTIASPGGASLHGLTVSRTSGNVYFTNASNGLHVFVPNPAKDDKNKPYQLDRTVELPAQSFPCGVYVNQDESLAVVCMSKRNSVVAVQLKAPSAVVKEIKTGVAPFDILVDPDNESRFWISNIGGRFPKPDEQTAPSAGTETVVDSRGIANTGLVSLVDISTPDANIIRQLEVGRHSSTLARHDDSVFVCNTNGDSLTEFGRADKPPKTHSVKPDKALPFGSMPSDVLVLEDGTQLVALSGNNAILVRKDNKLVGMIPTGWYPVALARNKTHLFVANIKGSGARASVRPKTKGMNSHDHFGSVQRIRIEDIRNSDQLKQWTELVTKNSRLPQILRSMASKGDAENSDEVPVPEKLGQASTFKHVIYVIKENRTFDQVFGDLQVKGVRAEPKLCTFPESITPNHHALAKRFGILDNYYCNGVLSADGHSWATEANVTPYLERAFGGFSRSYTFGDDPITYSSSGFIWDKFLDAGLSFRNYGEMNYSKPPQGMKYQEIWKAYREGTPVQFEQKIGIQRLREYSCRKYPGWNMVIPDVLRIDRFLAEFDQFNKNGGLPSLCIVYLPQDHLGGGVTSRAHMADNDQAIGKLVQAVSTSDYWKNTAIFINEDDPQNGYDHVDGHRSLCLVVSAYSKPGVNHQFYNQASVVRTILHIFGLAPLNQQDASAPLMTSCFQKTANLEPFQLIPTDIPLNETPLPKQQQGSIERRWRQRLATVPIERTGMKTEKDEDILNRFVWHEIKGWSTPYPVEWTGPHGRGLSELGLKRDPEHHESD